MRLADHFYLLLEASDPRSRSPEELSELFSSLRDLFRDQPSRHNRQKFRRRGHVTATIRGALEPISGSADGPSIDPRLLCSGCGTESHISSPFALLALPVFPAKQAHGLFRQATCWPALFSRSSPPCVYISVVPAMEGKRYNLSLRILPGSDSKWDLITPSPHRPLYRFGSPVAILFTTFTPSSISRGGPLHCSCARLTWRMVEL